MIQKGCRRKNKRVCRIGFHFTPLLRNIMIDEKKEEKKKTREKGIALLQEEIIFG